MGDAQAAGAEACRRPKRAFILFFGSEEIFSPEPNRICEGDPPCQIKIFQLCFPCMDLLHGASPDEAASTRGPLAIKFRRSLTVFYRAYFFKDFPKSRNFGKTTASPAEGCRKRCRDDHFTKCVVQFLRNIAKHPIIILPSAAVPKRMAAECRAFGLRLPEEKKLLPDGACAGSTPAARMPQTRAGTRGAAWQARAAPQRSASRLPCLPAARSGWTRRPPRVRTAP